MPSLKGFLFGLATTVLMFIVVAYAWHAVFGAPLPPTFEAKVIDIDHVGGAGTGYSGYPYQQISFDREVELRDVAGHIWKTNRVCVSDAVATSDVDSSGIITSLQGGFSAPPRIWRYSVRNENPVSGEGVWLDSLHVVE